MSFSMKNIIIGFIAGLVIGLILGYAITGSNTSKLEQQIGQLEEQVKDLQNQLASKDNQILELQNQLADKETEISMLKSQLAEKITEIDELQSQLKLLNAPVSSFPTIIDLKITITTHKHIYSYKEPISGNVTVYYLNGTAFKGRFSIYIKNFEDGMSTTSTFPVEGYGEFHVKTPAFTFGPGKYRVGISLLFDAEGFIVEGNHYLFPYVEVEAK